MRVFWTAVPNPVTKGIIEIIVYLQHSVNLEVNSSGAPWRVKNNLAFAQLVMLRNLNRDRQNKTKNTAL